MLYLKIIFRHIDESMTRNEKINDKSIREIVAL